ncbi:MAG TPA: hypothetical protein VIY72_16905 [Acidimicrobiales bacterium]
MRDVLVVLFWLWVLMAVGVYAYRIWRRVTKGSKAERQAAAQTAGSDGSEPAGGRLGRSAPPPLPDGPVEARLPKALQDQGPPATSPASPRDQSGADLVSAPAPVAETPPRMPTVAETVQGIQMPDRLLPVVDPADSAMRDGRLARFAGTGTTVEAVTIELAAEFARLGFSVDGLATATPVRAGLSASRDGATVAASVAYDDDSTAVVVELTTA